MKYNLLLSIISTKGREVRTSLLNEVPEKIRDHVKKLVLEYFTMRTKRQIASEQARAMREDERRKAKYGR